jgi:Na+/proline symporter
LTLAAVFAAAMSTLSGSFNSSATALVKDFIVPLRKSATSPSAELVLGKVATGGFGLLQVMIAWAAYRRGVTTSVVESVLTIAAFASGPMLGLYSLGVLTRVGEWAALCGFVAGLACLTCIAVLTNVTFPWYALFGTCATMAVGLVASLFERPSSRPPTLTPTD